MKNAFEELEFYKVKALIKNYCTSSLGEKLVDKFQPLKNKSEIEERINKLSDSFEFLKQKNSFHLEGLADTKSLFPQLNHKEHFTIPEFLLFAHNVRIANNLKRNEAIKERNFPYLFSIVPWVIRTRECGFRRVMANFLNIFSSGTFGSNNAFAFFNPLSAWYLK